jgi:hypothetical protein
MRRQLRRSDFSPAEQCVSGGKESQAWRDCSQTDNKFNEIVELLARELSHAKNDPRVHDEAESAIQRWAEDAQMAEHPIETKGELQRLLKEHHQIAEEIMDVRDWAMED